MRNVSIIILVKEQSMTLHSFYNSVEIKHRETGNRRRMHSIHIAHLVNSGLAVIFIFFLNASTHFANFPQFGNCVYVVI